MMFALVYFLAAKKKLIITKLFGGISRRVPQIRKSCVHNYGDSIQYEQEMFFCC